MARTLTAIADLSTVNTAALQVIAKVVLTNGHRAVMIALEHPAALAVVVPTSVAPLNSVIRHLFEETLKVVISHD